MLSTKPRSEFASEGLALRHGFELRFTGGATLQYARYIGALFRNIGRSLLTLGVESEPLTAVPLVRSGSLIAVRLVF